MTAPELKIGLVQADLLWEDRKGNLSKLESMISAGGKGCDIVILPEMFTTGFSMNVSEMAEENGDIGLAWMLKTSGETGSILCGSLITKEGGKYYNRLHFVRPEGTYTVYDKRHLFQMAGEDKYYSAGKSNITEEVKGWRIRPLICYDLRFPVWCRNRYSVKGKSASAEYDVLIFCANWPSPRIIAWDVLLRARAVENQAYCIGVNRTGSDGNNQQYNGRSAVIGPRGEYLFGPADDREGVFITALSYRELSLFREKFPQGLDADGFVLSQ